MHKKVTGEPIFIHSLFRAGSTYLFNVFRRSAAGYWCYQEPLHEAVIDSNEDPDQLMANRDNNLVDQLRHPSLDLPYFKELHDVWPAWKDRLDQAEIYDAYFAPKGRDAGVSYFRVLADAATGRPVFQECRSSGRIGFIKERMVGTHIYLWRNPWDQWWSYKVSRYFDVVNRIIINATDVPLPILKLRDALGIEKHDVSKVGDAFEYFWCDPLNSEKSYQIFYLLWILGLYEGMKHADLLLNIDSLSDSPAYQREIQDELQNSGISGIDFSDCQIPQGWYQERDEDFFAPLEDSVHQWLTEGGWPPERLSRIRLIRQQFAPADWGVPITSRMARNSVEQASRARALTRRFETDMAENARSFNDKIAVAQAEARKAEYRATQAESRLKEAESRISDLLNSSSWKITAPIRLLRRFIQRERRFR